MTTLPRDWKPLREAAELAAREQLAAICVATDSDLRWEAINEAGQDWRRHASASLLADLTRPASRDYWARKLAEWCGIEVGATAPNWWSGIDGGAWRLVVNGKTLVFHNPGDSVTWNCRSLILPGIASETNPAAALRLALLATKPLEATNA